MVDISLMLSADDLKSWADCALTQIHLSPIEAKVIFGIAEKSGWSLGYDDDDLLFFGETDDYFSMGGTLFSSLLNRCVDRLSDCEEQGKLDTIGELAFALIKRLQEVESF